MNVIYGRFKRLWSNAGQAEYETMEEMPEEGTMTSVAAPDLTSGEVPHAEPGALQAVKSSIKGHGEQTVLPDDCEFGDNDLCYVEA